MNIFLFGGILLVNYVEVVTSENGCGEVCFEHGQFTTLLNFRVCRCYPGFTGSCCEINLDIDQCVSNPCQYGGTCSEGMAGYICSCKAGFDGVNCETDIDQCVSNPCQYGGTCQDGIDGYSCSCKAGFDGVNCETEKNECASNPCVNGATCVDLFNRFKCDCLDGDSGKFCEIGPTVTVAPKIQLISEKTVVEGTHDLEIACYAQGIPTPVVTWEEIDAKFQPNVRQIGQFLVIENVTMADKGYYTCTAKNRVGTDIKVVSIIVNAKNTRPFIAPLISTSSTVIVKYYTDATLFCNVTGYPKPSVKWEYQKNRTIPGAKISGGRMLIPNVTKETTGLYTCIATNSVGSSRANIMLETTYDYPTFLTSPRAYSGNAGTSHNFTCITTGHPAPTITWTFSSFSHQIDTLPPHKIYSHGDVLELVNMQVSGTLTCTATNEFGLDTATATVIIHHSSAVVG